MQHCYATHAQINCILSLISSKGIRLRHGMWSQGTSYEAELRKTLQQDIKRFTWNSTVFDKNLAKCKLYIVKLHCIVIQTYMDIYQIVFRQIRNRLYNDWNSDHRYRITNHFDGIINTMLSLIHNSDTRMIWRPLSVKNHRIATTNWGNPISSSSYQFLPSSSMA